MLRVVFIHLLFFALPFAAYGFWLMVTRRSANAQDWRDAPMLWLTIAGGAMVIVSFIVLASFEDNTPDGGYTPLQYKDGQLVPGRLD